MCKCRGTKRKRNRQKKFPVKVLFLWEETAKVRNNRESGEEKLPTKATGHLRAEAVPA